MLRDFIALAPDRIKCPRCDHQFQPIIAVAATCPECAYTYSRPVLVGESNPYGADPAYALFPSPESSAGYRLCTMVLGLSRKRYLETFDRVNLCAGKWGIREARTTAASLKGRPLILCGAKVCSAFGITFEPFSAYVDKAIAVIPHPSGLCRLWVTEENAVNRARAAITLAIPDLQPIIGRNT